MNRVMSAGIRKAASSAAHGSPAVVSELAYAAWRSTIDSPSTAPILAAPSPTE